MQDFEREGDGMTPDKEAQLKAEIERAIKRWGDTYEPVGLELPITILEVLMKEISEEEGLESYVDFCEQAGNILQNQSRLIKKVLYEDHLTSTH